MKCLSVYTLALLMASLLAAVQVDLSEIPPFIHETVQIPPVSTREWEFEASAGEQVFLSLTTRQMSEAAMGGFNYSIQFMVNGKPLRARFDRQTMLLINRPDHFTFRDGRTLYYDQGDGSWLAIFSNSYKNSPARLGIRDPEPYTYQFDLTPLLRNGKNHFSARNLRAKNDKIQLIEVMLSLHRRPMPDGMGSKNEAALPHFPAPTAFHFTDDGALFLDGTPPVRLVSAFSQPGGGFNFLGDSGSADPAWRWQVSQQSPVTAQLDARAKNYEISRKVRLLDNRLQITDTLRNLSQEDLALRYRHALDFSAYSLPVCRMGGQESHSLNDYSSADNSTLFYPARDSGLGIVLEDDFSRNQSKLFYDAKAGRSGFFNDAFYLEPGASYQVEWSLYVTPSNDYFDLINQVRRDWNLNYTIEGPVYFVGTEEVFTQPEAELRRHIEEKQVRYLCFWEIRTPQDVKIPEADNKAVVGMGGAIFSPVLEAQRLRHVEAARRWRELFPQVKVSQYYHCFFQGFEMPDDMTHQDSFIVDSTGKRLPSAYSSAVYYVFRSIYPKPGNSYWKVHMDCLDFLHNEMNIDWTYWDESNGPGTTAKEHVGSAPVTFNAEDGHSALIDLETNRVMQKCAILAVVSAPALQEGIRRTLDKGGIVLFNGPPTLRYRSQPRVYSMAETQDVIARAYQTHLGTPLAYGYGTPEFRAVVERLNYGCLYVRTHLNYASDAVSKCYPFTPMELHRGWLKGKERIITNQSGEFGWDGAFTARLWRYDAEGRKLEEVPTWQTSKDHITVVVPDGGMAILERQLP